MTWFDDGAAYASGRPTYPADLVAVLADLAPSRDLAVDVGCGTGQLSVLLADHVDRVIGVDPSGSQIDAATPASNVEYLVGPAEHLPIDDTVASLITVAQAAHWFDLPAFYDEARRIARPDAVLALITYGVVVLDDDLTDRFGRFYTDEIGPYWPPERAHVDAGYTDLPFPFERIDVDAPPIERDWTLDEFVDYLRTWSAMRRAGETGTELVSALRADLAPVWGDRRRVTWPITVLAGRVA